MVRQAPPPRGRAGEAQANVPPVSGTVCALRKCWQFAAVCQFLFTFEEALNIDGFQTVRLERALDVLDMDYLASLACALLRPLATPAQVIDRSTWQDVLRKRYVAREYDPAPLGTMEDPVDWASLPPLDKIRTLHDLCEWQLERPDRLRRNIESEEDARSWRVDPAGWDRENNTYWLFDDNRLWIQRVPPRPKKKRRPPPKKAAAAKRRAPPGRRSSRLGASEVVRPEDVFDTDSELSAPSDEEPEWVEFETICITRPEWEAFAAQFAQSKHPDERALHRYVHDAVLPRVVEAIAEEERKRALELALSNRKRSSRIAMKESEREERERELAQLEEQRQREREAVAAERARREREQAEFEAKHSREMRLREREERIMMRERSMLERAQRAEGRHRAASGERSASEAADGSTTPQPASTSPAPGPSAGPVAADTVDSDWMLDCEVCGQRQRNPVEPRPLVCCEMCGVWQHTPCWDMLDQQQGRPQRQWDQQEFSCLRCQRATGQSSAQPAPASRPTPTAPSGPSVQPPPARPPAPAPQPGAPSGAAPTVAPRQPPRPFGQPPRPTGVQHTGHALGQTCVPEPNAPSMSPTGPPAAHFARSPPAVPVSSSSMTSSMAAVSPAPSFLENTGPWAHMIAPQASRPGGFSPPFASQDKAAPMLHQPPQGFPPVQLPAVPRPTPPAAPQPTPPASASQEKPLVMAPRAAPTSPQSMRPFTSPSHSRAPTSSFPLRTHMAPSPLSRASEPDDPVPTSVSLGSSAAERPRTEQSGPMHPGPASQPGAGGHDP